MRLSARTLALSLVLAGVAAGASSHEPHGSPAAAKSSAPAGRTLYQRLGGYDALAAVTDDFLGRLATDPELGKFFPGHSTDSLDRIRQLIVDQLCFATGGPCKYIGRDMKTSHAGMGITEAHFAKAAALLTATLDKFNVPAAENAEVLALVSSLEADIVEK
jgi:hemoglobin